MDNVPFGGIYVVPVKGWQNRLLSGHSITPFRANATFNPERIPWTDAAQEPYNVLLRVVVDGQIVRLGEARNTSVLVEDAQALTFSDETFDAVVCNLGLMFFPEPAQALSEFRRVLRPGGWIAASVNTVPARSYNHQINVILTRYVPDLCEAVTRTFSLGEASRLEEVFRKGGFSHIKTRTVNHTFVLPSFDAYYGPFERGGASTGQALAILPDEIRRAVRDEVRRDLGDEGGPIGVEVEYRIASAQR
jgi:SAM-dependent methyltransferase